MRKKSLPLFSWASTSGKFNLLTKVIEAGFPADNRVPLVGAKSALVKDVCDHVDGMGLRRYDAHLPGWVEQHPQRIA